MTLLKKNVIFRPFSPDSPGYGLNLTKGTSFWLKHLAEEDFEMIDKLIFAAQFHLSQCLEN